MLPDRAAQHSSRRRCTASIAQVATTLIERQTGKPSLRFYFDHLFDNFDKAPDKFLTKVGHIVQSSQLEGLQSRF